MARVFISYAREDGEAFARGLEAKLQGYDPWYDRRQLTPGLPWDEKIVDGIDQSDVFLVVLTRGYERGAFALKELQRAIDQRKPVIPLRFHADAGLPIEIQRNQWIAFTNGLEDDENLVPLREAVDLLARGGSLTARDLRAGRWDLVQLQTAEWSREAVRGHFDEKLYVARESADEQFARFRESATPALLVIGNSGTGKSSLLYRWTLDLLGDGNAVLLYDCGALAEPDVEEEIARDFGIPREQLLDELGPAAAQAGKKVWFVFDSIGDYRGAESAPVLLRSINKLVERVHAEQVRVIASCNSGMWGRFEFRPGSRWFRSGDDAFLRLDKFTESERNEAYRRYREAFHLHSPIEQLDPVVQEQLRDPILLRMAAEAYHDEPEPIRRGGLGVRVFHKFLEDRLTTPATEALVDDLAGAMRQEKKSALSLADLKKYPEIRAQIVDENPRSAYAALLNCGVLQQLHDPRSGTVVRFSHTRIASYAVAKSLLATAASILDTTRGVVADASQFPLAWQTAKTLLLLSRDEAAIAALASSHDAEERELASEALVELHADDAQAACNLLQKLLDQPSEEGRRTALKAAYSIGPAVRDFFMRAAIDGGESLRESVRNTLYLIWRKESPAGRRAVADTIYLIGEHSRGFTYGFLKSMIDDFRITKVKKIRPTLEFALDLIITIYINHCDEDEVIEQTATLMHTLTVEKLPMPLLLKFERLDLLRKVVLRAFTRVFGSPILNFMMFGNPRSVQDFFRLPAERRASLGRIADAFDPAADIAAHHDELAAMLSADMPLFSGSAGLAIAVHAAHDFAATEPLVRQLWNESSPRGRLWLLISFSVLMKATPPDWVALLEDLTRQYVEQHRDEFLGDGSRLPGGLDIVALPLGLAYSKAGSSMPLFDELLRDALAKNDTPLAARIISGLAAVGFYDPLALFGILDPAFAHLGDERIADALVTTLAIVRTLHFDAVDRFLHEKNAPPPLRHRVDTTAGVALVHDYIRVLGYYNNAVHFTLRYPRMRGPLSTGALKLLAKTPSAPAFATDYTMSAIRMLRDSEFNLRKWTLP
ncbi:MAG TPA: TIR domain-containing protein [Thermoanaerobaculia bacterium]|nr:TIR domain-containing protein [Thermoanaerobaculia bacterium]